MADPTQIHQILMNLRTHAEHAMREKGGVLKEELEDVELDYDVDIRTGSIEALELFKAQPDRFDLVIPLLNRCAGQNF